MAGGKGGPGRLLRHDFVRRPALSLAGAVVPAAGAGAPRGHSLGGRALRAAGAPRALEPASVDGLADGALRRLHRRGAALTGLVAVSEGLSRRGLGGGG